MKTLVPVAVYRGPLKDKFGLPRQSGLAPDLPGRIVLEPPFRDAAALRKLECFGRIWLLWDFHAAVRTGKRPGEAVPADRPGFSSLGGGCAPTVRPPRLGGNRSVGVFASRSPFRPNGLGLSCVRLERIEPDTPEGPVLYVSGADLLDGTPIYDIKPYLPYADSFPDAEAGFTEETDWKPLEVVFPEELVQRFAVLWAAAPAPGRTDASQALAAARQLLAQDPRPAYQEDPERTYGMRYGSVDIRFRVREGTLTVTGVESGKRRNKADSI